MNNGRQSRGQGKQPKTPALRYSTLQRLEGKSPTHERCPNCKKLRQKWFRANAYSVDRMPWERIEEGKSKVCHICVARHRGTDLPVVGGGLGRKSSTKKKRPPREQPPS